jgi:hypothetical protein
VPLVVLCVTVCGKMQCKANFDQVLYHTLQLFAKNRTQFLPSNRSGAKHSRINAKWKNLSCVVKHLMSIYVDALTSAVFICMLQFFYLVSGPRNESQQVAI